MPSITKLQPGTAAPALKLPAVDGSTVTLADELKRHLAVVVLFICNHCPYVKAYIPRLIALQKEFVGKARLLAICSNDEATYPDDSFENMKKTADQWGMNFPYLHDGDQSAARAFGAERTPEIFLLDSAGVCRYEGGIDDNYQDPAKVTKRSLHDAIAALIAGEPVKEPTSYAIGCTIKWKK